MDPTAPGPPGLTIGRVAQQAGVRADTVRFYEKRGLIPPPARTASGYRHFPPETVGRIRFVKRAQELGFTLEEIRELLDLRDRGEPECVDVMHLAEQKQALIDAKIADLQAMRRALERLIRSCREPHAPRECPIIESLDRSG